MERAARQSTHPNPAKHPAVTGKGMNRSRLDILPMPITRNTRPVTRLHRISSVVMVMKAASNGASPILDVTATAIVPSAAAGMSCGTASAPL